MRIPTTTTNYTGYVDLFRSVDSKIKINKEEGSISVSDLKSSNTLIARFKYEESIVDRNITLTEAQNLRINHFLDDVKDINVILPSWRLSQVSALFTAAASLAILPDNYSSLVNYNDALKAYMDDDSDENLENLAEAFNNWLNSTFEYMIEDMLDDNIIQYIDNPSEYGTDFDENENIRAFSAMLGEIGKKYNISAFLGKDYLFLLGLMHSHEFEDYLNFTYTGSDTNADVRNDCVERTIENFIENIKIDRSEINIHGIQTMRMDGGGLVDLYTLLPGFIEKFDVPQCVTDDANFESNCDDGSSDDKIDFLKFMNSVNAIPFGSWTRSDDAETISWSAIGSITWYQLACFGWLFPIIYNGDGKRIMNFCGYDLNPSPEDLFLNYHGQFFGSYTSLLDNIDNLIDGYNDYSYTANINGKTFTTKGLGTIVAKLLETLDTLIEMSLDTSKLHITLNDKEVAFTLNGNPLKSPRGIFNTELIRKVEEYDSTLDMFNIPASSIETIEKFIPEKVVDSYKEDFVGNGYISNTNSSNNISFIGQTKVYNKFLDDITLAEQLDIKIWKDANE